MNQSGGDGGPGLPWSSLLDPKANARAFGEVQAMGLRAAGDLVERFVRSVDGDPPESEPATPTDGTDSSGSAANANGAADIGGLVEVWMDFLRRTAEAFGRPDAAANSPGPAQSGPTGSVGIDLPGGATKARLRIVVDGGGESIGPPTEVWLHNRGTADVGALALRSFELRAADGSTLAGALTFDPPEIGELPARTSRGIVVGIDPTAPLVAGMYRGVVQAAGAPDLWLPVEVIVEDAS